MVQDKYNLLEKLLAKIGNNAEVIAGAAQYSRQAAIDAPGRNQSRYDSSREEQGYLADGLNLRRQQIITGIHEAGATQLPQRPESVMVGTLVRLDQDGQTSDYFVLSYGAGNWIESEEGEVLVITPNSPLFQAMKGKKKNEEFSFSLDRRRMQYKIVDIL